MIFIMWFVAASAVARSTLQWFSSQIEKYYFDSIQTWVNLLVDKKRILLPRQLLNLRALWLAISAGFITGGNDACPVVVGIVLVLFAHF